MLRNPFRQASRHAQERLAQCKAPMAFVCAGLIAGALLPLGGGTGAASSTPGVVGSECAAACVEACDGDGHVADRQTPRCGG